MNNRSVPNIPIPGITPTAPARRGVRWFAALCWSLIGLVGLQAAPQVPTTGGGGLLHYSTTTWTLNKTGTFNPNGSTVNWTVTATKGASTSMLLVAGYIDAVSQSEVNAMKYSDLAIRLNLLGTEYAPSALSLFASDGVTPFPTYLDIPNLPPNGTYRLYFVAQFPQGTLPPVAFVAGTTMLLSSMVTIYDPIEGLDFSEYVESNVTVPAATPVNGTVTLTDNTITESGSVTHGLFTPISLSLSNSLTQPVALGVDGNCAGGQICNTATLTGAPVTLSTLPSVVIPGLSLSSTSCVDIPADNRPPRITLVAPITVPSQSGLCGAEVNYTVIIDDCDLVSTVYSHPSGSVFPLGTTTVTITATDFAGHVSTSTFTVTVTDSEAPVLTVPATIVVNNTPGNCDALVPFVATATDCTAVSIVYSLSPSFAPAISSPRVFPVGTTTVYVKATDTSGNSSTGSFLVTVNDSQAPVLTVPANISVNNTAGTCGANVTFAATATDCSAVTMVYSLSATYSPAIVSGANFPIGTTTVYVKATDTSGNSSTGSFTVTVTDTEAPVLTVPANISVSNTAGTCGANVPFAATATDCSAVTMVYSLSNTYAPAIVSGANFPIGTTTVYVKATDASGNSSTGSFTVTVTDTEAPVLTVPANISVNNTAGTCGANVTFAATATDCSVVTLVYSLSNTFSPAIVSGANFPVGTTTVHVKATDASGNSSTGSFTVTVADTEAPVLTVPANISVNSAQGTCGANVTFEATATDCSAVTMVYSLSATYSPAIVSGANFPVGTTTVHVKATDASGNSSTGSFTVTVVDNQPPVLTVPANIVVNNTPGSCDALVPFVATATDCTAVTMSYSLTANFAQLISSPATFPIGTTTVYVKATDAAGNSSTGSFTVKVVDADKPVIAAVANITKPADAGLCTAVVTFNVSATDCSPVTVVASPASGSVFPKGTTTVTVTATDAAGNVATSTFTVTVTDTQAPVITSALTNLNLQNDAGKCYATFSYTSTATDNCPGVVVTHSPANGTQLAAGSTTTVTVTAMDSSGNTTVRTFTVTVADCLGSLGNLVWHDANKNGIQDNGEAGIDGVKVTLFTSAGTQVGSPLTTSGGGFYRFDNLTPGAYYVIFDKTTLPAGFVFTSQNTGANDAVDSDANVVTGKSEGNATVVGGQYNDTVDAGAYAVPALNLVCAGGTGTVGTPYSGALVASGGTPPYTYSISSGSLPPGLTLAPATGAITGTPTTAGTYNYTAMVTDSTNGGALVKTSSCAITITGSVCTPSTFGFTGNSAVSGTAGNIRTFTVNGISVKASAFSRVKGTNGAWSTAYLGAYSGGLGVTDGSEDGSSASHTVDNIGRDNFVLFEFSQPVVVNRAYLGYVVSDSDISVWLGNAADPYNNHQTLTDSFLNGLVREDNVTDLTTTRWAAVNATQRSGNILVVAGYLDDTSPEDQFKIGALDICQGTAPAVTLGCVSATSGNVGVPYTSALQATGGTPAYTFSITAGALPAGLTLNTATGTISGTPTTAGAFSFTAKVVDSTGTTGTHTASQSCTITITTSACVPSTFNFSGSTAGNGTTGNIRTFTVNGITVKASGFSRTKGTYGSWAAAYLGAFSGGLGVTDTSEDGNGNSHTVDNIGRDNFVLFEFSRPVVINRAYLGYVVTDSDLSVWVGNVTNAYTNHITLSDSVLNGLVREDNFTDSGAARWAKLNAGLVSGNVLVIAGNIDDTSPEDQFKIAALDICQPQGGTPVTLGCVSATSGTVGVAYSSALVAQGGTPGYTFSITSGSLPAGLTLNASTGAITGTPTTKGSFSFTAKVVDSTGGTGNATASVSCCITIAPSTTPTYTGSIGSLVWKDLDGDGIQDAGEPGIPGVTVQLKNSSGTVIATDVTDSSGVYGFEGLSAGSYTVVVATPGGFTRSTSLVGSNRAVDSNGSPAAVNLATNSSSDQTIDFGFVPTEICAKPMVTYTQGGWGSTPRGNNPGSFLTKNFSAVYPGGSVSIGSNGKVLTFTSAAAIINFLPQGGTPARLTASATNPTTCAAGVLAGQLLALKLNVDFSAAGRTATGLGAKKAGSGPLAGKTVNEILAIANSVIGGGALPAGMTLASLNEVLTDINENYDNGTSNDGYLY